MSNITNGTMKDIGYEGFYAYYEKGLWGIKNIAGEIICKPKYSFIEKFKYEGYARVGYKDKTCFIDTDFERKFEEYLQVRPFINGFAAVQTFFEKWTFIDANGNKLTNKCYAEVGAFDTFSYARVFDERTEKFGFIDRNGEEVFGGCIYDFAEIQKNARLRVRLNGDEFFISKY